MPSILEAAGAKVRHQPFALLIIFCMLAACIIAAGYVYYRHSVVSFSLEVERRVSVTANLKAAAIEQYRNERQADAQFFHRNMPFGDLVSRFLAEPGNEVYRDAIEEWVAKADSGGVYDRVSLLDATGAERLAVSENGAGLSAIVVLRAMESLESGAVEFVDFYRSERDQRIYLAVVAPVTAPSQGGTPIAVLVFGIDPATYLYPVVADASGAGQPLDTVLVRRDDGHILFLSDPWDRSGAALAHRVAIDDWKLSVTQVVSGNEGVVRGENAQRTAEIAYGRSVSDSPWYIVSGIPEAEAFAPLRQLLWLIVILVSALLVGVAAALFGTVLDTVELRRKDEELRAKNSEMEHFTYAVSHDLKSPLWTVKTFLGFVEQDVAAGVEVAKLQKSIDHIRTATGLMGRLLDELRKMSRIGRQEHAPARVTLSEVIDEALDAVAGRIAERSVTVKNETEAITLFADRSRLVEVWQNLLDNAVKYMGEQTQPEIVIGTERKGRTTLFYVRDNGMGIEPQYHKKVFGLFERLDNEGDSTGLGLALVKRIVELYGGTIWVESSGKGGGSVFKFSLPGAALN